MKILFRCIFNAALFLMLIVAMVLLLPGLFGIRPYVVYSGSMEPKIPTGAVVFIKEGAYSLKREILSHFIMKIPLLHTEL